MTEKELKRLSRAELLELLLIQTRETERLKVQLETAQAQLNNREIQIRESGSLAEAVLVVNGVFESTQAAAAQYLENIARMEAETEMRCRRMLEDARAEAQRLRTDEAPQPVQQPEPPTIQETPEADRPKSTWLEEARKRLGRQT